MSSISYALLFPTSIKLAEPSEDQANPSSSRNKTPRSGLRRSFSVTIVEPLSPQSWCFGKFDIQSSRGPLFIYSMRNTEKDRFVQWEEGT